MTHSIKLQPCFACGMMPQCRKGISGDYVIAHRCDKDVSCSVAFMSARRARETWNALQKG